MGATFFCGFITCAGLPLGIDLGIGFEGDLDWGRVTGAFFCCGVDFEVNLDEGEGDEDFPEDCDLDFGGAPFDICFDGPETWGPVSDSFDNSLPGAFETTLGDSSDV